MRSWRRVPGSCSGATSRHSARALGGLGTEGGRVELAGQGDQDAASRRIVEARVPAGEPVE
jgi:hypothetical protein